MDVDAVCLTKYSVIVSFSGHSSNNVPEERYADKDKTNMAYASEQDSKSFCRLYAYCHSDCLYSEP